MITGADLKTIQLFSGLNDHMLDRVAPLTAVRECKKDEQIFAEGDPANALYMLVKGKILLNMEASETICVSLMAVEPGDAFGWSSILGRGHYSASAVCSEPCTLWSVLGKDMMILLYNDPAMGFKIMEFVARAMNERLAKRNSQLIKTLLENIDLVCGLRQESA